VAYGTIEAEPSRWDRLQTLDLDVIGCFGEGRPCRKNGTN
jgi:hypothetical protein